MILDAHKPTTLAVHVPLLMVFIVLALHGVFCVCHFNLNVLSVLHDTSFLILCHCSSALGVPSLTVKS